MRPTDSIPRVIEGLALLASGGIHLRLYVEGYRHVPTIGPLFLAQVAACAVFGLLLLAGRTTRLAVPLGGLVGLGTAAGLLAAATVGVFGFHDALSAPLAGASLLAEGIVAASAVVWLSLRRARRHAPA